MSGLASTNSNMCIRYKPCIISKNFCTFCKILLACNRQHVLYVSTFDEDLLKHISHELADDVGRESDTS
jgi:hypothetical protein